jgi:hypothetical protein
MTERFWSLLSPQVHDGNKEKDQGLLALSHKNIRNNLAITNRYTSFCCPLSKRHLVDLLVFVRLQISYWCPKEVPVCFEKYHSWIWIYFTPHPAHSVAGSFESTRASVHRGVMHRIQLSNFKSSDAAQCRNNWASILTPGTWASIMDTNTSWKGTSLPSRTHILTRRYLDP